MYKAMVIILVLYVSGVSCAYALLRDPTKPPANITMPTAVSPASFQLTAIIIGVNRRFAVINGLKMQVGDEILGERVIEINNNTVQLEGPNGKLVLFLFGKPIKQLMESGCERKWNLCMDAKV